MERVIRDFNGGLLDAAPGTTLRSYLSDRLNCAPMRITKKFTGGACAKRLFRPRENADPAAIEGSRREIAALEATWRRKLVPAVASKSPASKKRKAMGDATNVDA